MVHDFKQWPELTNGQMAYYYFDSPHKQIGEDFDAEVIRVHDGDTVTLRTNFRDFDFPLRFSNIASPELDEKGGLEARDWMIDRILGKLVRIGVNRKNRVEKWGRLLGTVTLDQIDVGLESVLMTDTTTWEQRNDGKILDVLA